MIGSNLSPLYRTIAIAFAVIVVVKHSHCIATAAPGAANNVARIERAIAGEDGIDQGPSPRCENESSCICRGATLVVAVPQPQIDLSACSALPAINVGVVESQFADPVAALDARFESTGRSAPISGRLLRAHLASLLN